MVEHLTRLDSLEARVLLPGRGAPLLEAASVRDTIAATRGFLDAVWTHVKQGRTQGLPRRAIFETTRAAMEPVYGSWPVFQHVLPFDVCRAIEEQEGGGEPSIWTEERDRLLWTEASCSPSH